MGGEMSAAKQARAVKLLWRSNVPVASAAAADLEA